jgi:hypothetical protein
VQRSGCQHFIFVIVGDRDEQFGVTIVNGRAQIIAIAQGELVWITSSGRICDGELVRPVSRERNSIHWYFDRKGGTYTAYA